MLLFPDTRTRHSDNDIVGEASGGWVVGWGGFSGLAWESEGSEGVGRYV